MSTTVLSIDDLYLPHQALTKLAATHPTNPLIQHRGQPSTHDLPLANALFSALRAGRETRIPAYDKSAFKGQGDREPPEKWAAVNQQGDVPIKVVILEGWCVGFRALSQAELQSKWHEAVSMRESIGYEGRLGWNKLEDLQFVNEALKGYDDLTAYEPSWRPKI